jgi:hypothetical protein
MFPWDRDFNPYTNAIELPMNYEHNQLSYGNKSLGSFRQELLYNNIYTTFDAIKLGFRTATTRKEKFQSGTYIIFTKTGIAEKLLCLVIKSSYPVKNISNEEWSLLEGWDENYITLNPHVLNKFQFVFKFIKIIKC